MNREELAWAGGFFAGEGCTTVVRGRGRMSINQNHPEVLERCNRGHDYEGNRTEYGQCRACMRESDRRRLKAVI